MIIQTDDWFRSMIRRILGAWKIARPEEVKAFISQTSERKRLARERVLQFKDGTWRLAGECPRLIEQAIGIQLGSRENPVDWMSDKGLVRIFWSEFRAGVYQEDLVKSTRGL